MCQGDVMATRKVDHDFGLEFMGIVYYKLSRVAKSGKDIGFQKVHNHLVSSILNGNNLDPFGKLFSGSDDPHIISTGGWIYFTYEI
jgi:hypothetical protein